MACKQKKKPTSRRVSKRKREVQYQSPPQYAYKQQLPQPEHGVIMETGEQSGKSPMYMSTAELAKFNPNLPDRHRHGGYPFRNENALAVAYFLLLRKTKKKKQNKNTKSKKTKKRANKQTSFRTTPYLRVQCTDCENYGRLTTGKMGCKATLVPLTKSQAMRPKDCIFFSPTYIEI